MLENEKVYSPYVDHQVIMHPKINMEGIVFNNVAIAAERLMKKVLRKFLFDVDFHHGNGTQAIFYDRPDVYFASLMEILRSFPHFLGHANEKGMEQGGYNINYPMQLEHLILNGQEL